MFVLGQSRYDFIKSGFVVVAKIAPQGVAQGLSRYVANNHRLLLLEYTAQAFDPFKVTDSWQGSSIVHGLASGVCPPGSDGIEVFECESEGIHSAMAADTACIAGVLGEFLSKTFWFDFVFGLWCESSCVGGRWRRWCAQ